MGVASGLSPVALVIGSAALQAAGNALQKQRVRARVPHTSLARLARRPRAFFAPLLRDPGWLLGGLLVLSGAIVGLQALARMDLSMLKALGRLETLFLVVAGVLFLGERLQPRESLGLLLLLAGTAWLSLHAGEVSGHAARREAHLLLVTSVVVLLALLAFRPRTGPRSEFGLAVGAGLLFGTGDILMKGAIARVGAGGFSVVDPASLAALVGSPELAVAIATYLVGAIVLQAAFSVGRVSVIGAVMTLGSVTFPIAFGLVVLGEDASPGRLAGMAAIGLGSLLLGRRPPLPATEPPDRPTSWRG